MAEQIDRETKEFITPANNTVVLRTYLTGKESNELKGLMYADLKINATDATSGKVSLADIPAAFMIAQERKAMGFLLVSVNGDSNAPLEKLEALPESEYNAVLAEVQKIRVPLASKS
jgi:hypothetical protein